MSGSDFTLTTNLGLYKPLPNADINQWGSHLNLNADALDAAISSNFGVNVKAFGAKGDGATDDTAAIQAGANAIPASGGMLVFPGGVYVVTEQITIPSNTLVQGQGATLLGGFSVPQAFLTNRNFAATTLTDHDITVRDLTLDYGSSFQSGGSHAIHFMMVRNVRITNCTFQCRGAGDGVSLPGCYNSLIEGCSVYGFTNCAYDWWWGCTYGRLIGCNAETSGAVQMVAWNPENTAEQSNGLIAKGFVMSGCTFVGSGSVNAIPSQLEPLVAGNFASDIVVTGNVFINASVVMRGATSGCTITDNVFDAPLNQPAIYVVPLNGGNPADFTITGNMVVNPTTSSLAPLQIWTNSAVIANNSVVGASGNCLDTSTYTPNVGLNYFSNGFSNTHYSVMEVAPNLQCNNSPLQFVVTGTTAGAVFTNGLWGLTLTSPGGLGLFGASAPAAKPAVTGAKGSNAALASLLTALASYGLVTDSTTA